jgi:hypothetical protein
MKFANSARAIALSALLGLGAGFWYPAIWAATLSGADDIFSFDMWCLEMKLYPSQRCDVRRPEDVKAYEQYRATAERYSEQRAQQGRREQQLNRKLNPDPSNRTQIPITK